MTTAMHQGFLQDILEHPEEDTVRLIYADWLEENRQPERAEFIRLQIELAKREKVPGRPTDGMALLGWLVALHMETSIIKGLTGEPCDCEQCLRKREQELLTLKNAVLWTPNRTAFAAPDQVIFCRGFVSKATLDLAGWLAHGPAIVRATPLEVVRLSDRKPSWGNMGVGVFWYNSSSPLYSNSGLTHHLPACLWLLLTGEEDPPGAVKSYANPQDAVDDLSRACLRWAKEQPPPCSCMDEVEIGDCGHTPVTGVTITISGGSTPPT